jgi:hypothetical protein
MSDLRKLKQVGARTEKKKITAQLYRVSDEENESVIGFLMALLDDGNAENYNKRLLAFIATPPSKRVFLKTLSFDTAHAFATDFTAQNLNYVVFWEKWSKNRSKDLEKVAKERLVAKKARASETGGGERKTAVRDDTIVREFLKSVEGLNEKDHMLKLDKFLLTSPRDRRNAFTTIRAMPFENYQEFIDEYLKQDKNYEAATRRLSTPSWTSRRWGSLWRISRYAASRIAWGQR